MITNVWVKKNPVIPGIEVGTGTGATTPSPVGATTAVGTIPGTPSTAGGITIPSAVVVTMPAEPSCGTTTDTGGTGTGATTPGGGTGELDRDGLFPRLMGLATPGGACNVPFIIRIYVIYTYIINFCYN